MKVRSRDRGYGSEESDKKNTVVLMLKLVFYLILVLVSSLLNGIV